MIAKQTTSSKTKSTEKQDTKSSVMAKLLATYKKPIPSLKKGDSVKGIITKLSPKEVLVDINAKTDAVVLERDHKLMKNLLAKLKVGDEVMVGVLDPESEFGHPVVSLRRFMDTAMWEGLTGSQKEKTSVSVYITAATRGGFLATTDDGTAGFLPTSQLSFNENQQNLVGRKIEVRILEVNKAAHKVIFSQKALSTVSDFKEVTNALKVGQKITAVISSITPFGIFLSIPFGEEKYVDGLVHISELAWEKVTAIDELFDVGQSIDSVIIGFDSNGGRVDVSIKRLTEDPFAKIAKQLSVDQKVTGTVIKVTSMGIVVALTKPAISEEQAEVMIKKEKIPPTVTYEVGSSVTATIAEIDSKRHRITLVPVLKEKPIGYR